MKDISFFKVFALLFLIFVNLSEGRVKHSRHAASDEINEIGNRSEPISETATLSEYVSSGVSTVKRMIDALPSPYQVLHYGKQALIGVPEEMASETKRFLCESAVYYTAVI